ncbi:DNA-directed RNA polymerase II putative isoform 1 [Tripterygium wilfordii]|uniref:DNA-directed RNA polymerase II putative isoform 1 n=1 Tax=Tripterygium wilfordii TaxID=458696 RepID=A0A7J7DA15_TRIWF|nr:DNA-directed RNA polymerases II and IV subunit 5A-like [Tripterygium wilfordii]KAF5742916.1 DNA-directed RNA polymerase II putative isoform 1 [Tripterygium wilfordii]
MSAADEAIRRLFKAYKTIFKMLSDRGYSVEDSEMKLTMQQFVEKFGEKPKKDGLFMRKNKGENSSDKDHICVFFLEGQKVGVAQVRTCIERLKSEKVFSAILVVERAKGLSPGVNLAIKEVSTRFHIDVFEEAELLSNISEHALVPPHTVLTNQEKKELLDKYRVKEAQLPRILVTDPQAKYHGLKRGQVVKIVRDSQTADTYVTYRYCV